MITRDNYMLFFLDYYEGTLPEGQREELMRFLDAHADLKVEFFDFEMVELQKDSRVKYPDKDVLKKNAGVFDDDEKAVPSLKKNTRCSDMAVEVNGDNYESLFVAYVEGDLDTADASVVESFAASDEKYSRELRLMQLSKLQADENIHFPRKSALKRHFVGAVSRRKWHYSSAAAAVLLLAALVYSLLPVLDQTYIAEEIPVAGDQDAPEAVAATPVPQQDAMPLIAETEEVISRAAVGDLTAQTPFVRTPQPEYTRSYIGGPVALDLSALRGTTARPAPERLVPMPERPVGHLVAQVITPPPAPGRNEEVNWLAYGNQQVETWMAMDDADPPKEQETGLGGLLFSRISQAIGVDRVISEHADDSNPLLGMAGEGISRIAPATGNILGIETIRDESGRLVRLSVGDGFAITRR